MEEVLSRLAIYFEKEHSLKQKMFSSLLYPALVLLMALALTFYMLLYVLPVFADLFGQMNLELPWLTRWLLQGSSWLRQEGIKLAGFVAAGLLGLRFWQGKNSWLRWRDRIVLTLPVWGEFWRKAVIAQYCRTLGTLLGSGLALLPALDLAQRTTSNRWFLERLQAVRRRVSEGETLTASFGASELFPPLVVQLVVVAEETGKLEAMLAKVADFYEADVEEAAVRLGVLLEPFVIVFLGLLVGTLVLAVMLPVFESVGAIGSFK
jgi:type IV pilus assembly protein PilC